MQAVCGKEYVAEAALLRDYDNEWDAEEDVWHSAVDDISYDGWFRGFQKKHIPYDLVYISDKTELAELSKYKMVVYPHPTILTEERTALLQAYAEQGGTVIFGCRTGYKDLTGKCRQTCMPGFAAELCGIEVEDFTFLSPYDKDQYVNIGEKRVSAPCFNDVLQITDGVQLGTFESNYYAGKTALSLKKVGKGRVYYFGAAFAEDCAKAFIELEKLGSPMDLDSLIDMPESLELAVRGEYIFLLNYGEDQVEMNCSASFKDMISGEVFTDKITIKGYDAVVLKGGF